MALRWSPEVDMTKEEMDYFLQGRLIARLSTTSRDGYPHVTPVWYYWDGESIFFDLGVRRSTTRNLRRDPRCAAIVDLDQRPMTGIKDNMARAVLIKGVAELFEHKGGRNETFGAGRKRIVYEELAGQINSRYMVAPEEEEKLYQSVLSRASPRFHPHLRGEADRVLVRVRPRQMKGWDFSKAPWRE